MYSVSKRSVSKCDAWLTG